MPNFIDLTGQEFLLLKALEIVGKNKHGVYIYRCKCQCGNEKNISGASLRRGSTRSCGCLASLTAGMHKGISYEDLTNRMFGKLTVLHIVFDVPNRKDPKWMCECECGNKIICSARNLRNSGVKSCGCLAMALFTKNNGKEAAKVYLKTS